MTAHEERIALFKMNGLTNKEIAEKLKLSEKTIYVHLSKIYSELNVRNVGELIKEGTRLGISPYVFKTPSK